MSYTSLPPNLEHGVSSRAASRRPKGNNKKLKKLTNLSLRIFVLIPRIVNTKCAMHQLQNFCGWTDGSQREESRGGSDAADCRPTSRAVDLLIRCTWYSTCLNHPNWTELLGWCGALLGHKTSLFLLIGGINMMLS